MQIKKILFTSVGRRVELMQAFRNAATNLKMDLCIIGADCSESAPALFYCDKRYQICRIDSENYIPELVKICMDESVDLIIPTIDTDLLKLAESKKKFESLGTKVLVSDADKIAICRDKRLTAEFLRECGVATPMPVDDVELYEGSYPCFIKPYDGSSSINAYRVENYTELHEIAKRVPNYIIQPYISGKEYTVDIFCDYMGNPLVISPRERVATRSGEVLKTKIVQDDVAIAECRKIIEKFCPCGAMAVQYIKDDVSGDNYYLEINPRFGGGAPLTMKSGADMAEMVLRQLGGHKVVYGDKKARVGEVYSRFDQSICVSRGSIQNLQFQVSSIEEIEMICEEFDGIIFDLDDTLYSEKDYVRSGYRCIAAMFPDIKDAYEQLWKNFEEKRPAIDCFVEENGLDESWKEKLVYVYRTHEPDIKVYDGVYELMEKLKNKDKKIGIITDGRVDGQYAKIAKLNLRSYTDEIIVTDELAGNSDPLRFRKPNSLAFNIMKERFALPYERMVYIGDNENKDFFAPKNLGMGIIWFRNPDGLYNKNEEKIK